MCILWTKKQCQGDFEAFEMPTDRTQRIEEKRVHLSICHVYSQSYDFQNVKNGPLFVCSVVQGKKLVRVWIKYLSSPERSY